MYCSVHHARKSQHCCGEYYRKNENGVHVNATGTARCGYQMCEEPHSVGPQPEEMDETNRESSARTNLESARHQPATLVLLSRRWYRGL